MLILRRGHRGWANWGWRPVIGYGGAYRCCRVYDSITSGRRGMVIEMHSLHCLSLSIDHNMRV